MVSNFLFTLIYSNRGGHFIFATIHRNRKEYYRQLDIASKGAMNITPWVGYFVKIYDAVLDAKRQIVSILEKSTF